MKMKQVLDLDLLHVWELVWGGGKEGFVRTKMFLRLGGCGKTNLVLVGTCVFVRLENVEMRVKHLFDLG